MVDNSLRAVARMFLDLLPPGDYTTDELLAKFNMVLKIQGLETKDSYGVLKKVIHLRRKQGYKIESIEEKGKPFVYRRS